MLSPLPHKKRKEKKECDQGWAEISGQRKGRFLYFLWTGHFKETHVWAGFHQTASFSSWFWLAPGPATALVRSCWKGGCVPRLSGIFRAWGGRIFFYVKGRMRMSSKALVLWRSWSLAQSKKLTVRETKPETLLQEAKCWRPACSGPAAKPNTEVFSDFLIFCPFLL